MNEQEQERLAKRYDDANGEIEKAFKAIFKKSHQFLTVEDKRFLQARRSYLTDAQVKEYDAELSEKLPRPDGKEEEKTLDDMTRKELEAMATQEGIENPEDKKIYKTNADLQNAIKEKQEEKEKNN